MASEMAAATACGACGTRTSFASGLADSESLCSRILRVLSMVEGLSDGSSVAIKVTLCDRNGLMTYGASSASALRACSTLCLRPPRNDLHGRDHIPRLNRCTFGQEQASVIAGSIRLSVSTTVLLAQNRPLTVA